MAQNTPEPIPALSATLDLPAIMGVAALTTLAMNGTPLDSLLGVIEAADDDPIAQIFDMAVLCQLASRPADALSLQTQVIQPHPLLRVRNPRTGPAPLRLLALLAPGDLMVNTPLDFITAHLDVRLDILFLIPGQNLPPVIPDHDVLFIAISEADPATHARLRSLIARWPRPVVNDPWALPLLARDRLSTLLTKLPGIHTAPTIAASRTRLVQLLDDGGLIEDLLPGANFPALIRPHGSHAGNELEKLATSDDLGAYLARSTAEHFYLSQFVEYAAPDGYYRKYRIAFMDRRAELCHMAVSRHWMVHYLNAGMMDDAERRADEAYAMSTFECGFAHRHREAFQALHDRLPFDYYSIDCSELPDGRLLIFEADTGAIIHLMEDAEMFPYKHVQMHRVFEAFDAMLRRRLEPVDPAGTGNQAIAA